MKYNKLKVDPDEFQNNIDFWSKNRILWRGIMEDNNIIDADDIIKKESKKSIISLTHLYRYC